MKRSDFEDTPVPGGGARPDRYDSPGGDGSFDGDGFPGGGDSPGGNGSPKEGTALRPIDLIEAKRRRPLILRAVGTVRLVPMGLIRIYQHTLSPDHSPLMTRILPGGVCRFYPSCSQYTYEAIEKYGVIKGSIMGAWRILRCNPFNPGGHDPVP